MMRNNRLVFVALSLAMCLLLSNCSNEMNTLNILHANINCSDLEQSISFYEMLGFLPSTLTDVDVPAEEAAGLGMPPYQLRATPKMHLDGYVIDLIQWIEPYDPSAPYALMNHLGLSRISLQTTNLDADMTTLQAGGVEFFSEPVTIDRPVPGSRLVCFKDPDGTLIELVELGGSVSGAPNLYGTYITGALQTNVNCSDLERSRSFYEMLGFQTQVEVEEVGTPELATAMGLSSYHVFASTLTLPNGHNLNLTKWEEPYDSSAPYALVNHIGIPRFAILTANLDGDIAILKEQGVEFYSEPIRPEGPFGIFRFVCFEDPDGTIIELVGLF
jgi:catechol 2,3-dioxygenase-like lactoylglutathione lyase family enzyme